MRLCSLHRAQSPRRRRLATRSRSTRHSVRRRSLSDRPGGARAGECVDRRRRRRAFGVSAAARLALAIEPRHREQRLRPGAAAVGDSGADRSGASLGLVARASGAVRRARCSRGSRSISVCGTPPSSGAEAALTQARAGEALTRLDVQSGGRRPRSSSVARGPARRRRGAGGRRSPRCAAAVGPDARRQPAAAGRRSVARRRRTRGGADPADPGAAGRWRSRRRRLTRVLGIDQRRVAIDAATLLAGSACRRRPAAGSAARIRWRRSGRPPSTRRAPQQEVLARTRSAARLSCSRACSRAAAARDPNGAFDGGARRPGARSRELGGRRAGRLSERVRLLEPARAQGGGRGIDARRSGALRRSVAHGHEPATDGGRDAAGRARDRRQHAGAARRRAAERERRRAPATTRASPASSKSPTRRTCSRRPKSRISSRASTCGGRCWPRPSRRATSAPFLALVRQP